MCKQQDKKFKRCNEVNDDSKNIEIKHILSLNAYLIGHRVGGVEGEGVKITFPIYHLYKVMDSHLF